MNVPTVAETKYITKPQNDRLKTATSVIDFERAKNNATSQRQFAQEQEIPRSTLQGWITRKESISAHPDVVDFCESPVGIRFIHEIYTSALYEFNQCGPAGIRRIGNFIEKSPLSPFLASSYGTLQKDVSIMENNIAAFGVDQKAMMASKMSPKNISVCQDESFFPKPCLVAIEPVSGFILLEEFAEKRDAETWTAAMEKSLDGLPVNIIQATSDEAKGLLSHAAKGLGVHHSPDLFHGQREINKGIAPALSSLNRQVEHRLDVAKRETESQINERDQYFENINERGRGRPPDFDARIEAANIIVADAEKDLKAAQELKERTKTEIRGIGLDYHPINLVLGHINKADGVKRDLEERFESLYVIADELELAEHSIKRIEKAERLVPQMVATIAFFWKMVETIITGSILPKDVVTYIYDTLIPLAYLKMVLPKARRDQRDIIRTTIDRLTKISEASTNPLSSLDINTRTLVLNLAVQCAEIFQRSSSCVEGRNGVLSLHHHAGRSLTPRKLRALQVIHNFGLKRYDGSTAAQRLSGIKHPDLFVWILERQPLPARPRRSFAKTA